MQLFALRFALFSSFLFASLGARADLPTAVSIFDGKSLEGWQGDSKYWSVNDGAIVGAISAKAPSNEKQLLWWNGEINDIELSFEFRCTGGTEDDAGVLVRSGSRDLVARSYRINLANGPKLLGHISDKNGRGRLVESGNRLAIAPDGRRWTFEFDPAKVFQNLTKADVWNTCSISATGPHIEVWINDRLCSVLDDEDEKAARLGGGLAFEVSNPGELQLRNIRLTNLGKSKKPSGKATPYQKGNRQTESAVLWHLRHNPERPAPIGYDNAQRVVNGMMVTDGFQVDVVAAEPDLHQPIAFAIDHRGRLWVVEAFSYPTKQPDGQGKDRVLILEDADGDGSFETKKTFIEGLNLVSGIEVGFGGVWIGAAPELLFIPDADGDDRPDGSAQVLLDGFGYQDTHETLNSFLWGPDGWLYGNQGVFNTAYVGKPGADRAERKELRACVWRYHPTKHLFEVFADGGSNQWGLDYNEAGHLFMTHCRSYYGGGGTTHVIRNGYFWNQTNSNYAPFITNSAPTAFPSLVNFLPASARYDNGEGGAGKPGTTAIYGGHSPVGTMIYLGDNWPAIYRDRLFNHNLHGHQINQQVNKRSGSAYETIHAGYDLIWTPDPAFVAVDLQYGPDGAVYLTDWTDPQHCHNPHAEQWDRTNGRVFRLTWAETFRPVKVDLSKLNDLELVQQQDHANRWYGRVAQRLLQHRATKGKLSAEALTELHNRLQTSADQGVTLRALWALYVIDQLGESDLSAAIAHSSDIVRAWAVQFGTQNGGETRIAPEVLENLAQHDPSSSVRLAIASALPDLSSEIRWRVGEALALHREDAPDRFLPKMIWFGMAEECLSDVPRAMKLAATTPLDSLADSIHWYIAKSPQGRDALVELIATANEAEAAKRLLLLMQFALRYDPQLRMPKDWHKVATRFSSKTGADVSQARDELSALFGDQKVLADLRKQLADPKAQMKHRRRALAILKRVGDKQSGAVYLKLLDVPELRIEAMSLVAVTGDPAGATQLLKRLPTWNAAERDAALTTLTSRVDYSLSLLNAIQAAKIDKTLLSALYVRRMSDLSNKEVDALLEKVWGKVGSTDENAKALISKIRQTYTTAPLWAYDARGGAEVFKKTCAACHPIDGTTPLGPNLKGTAKNGLDYFLENIIDPNAVVGENFRTTLIVTNAGTVASGMLDTETDTTVVLRTADKTITVQKNDIDERRLANQSIMPTGLLDKLSETELIELLKFLTEKM